MKMDPMFSVVFLYPVAVSNEADRTIVTDTRVIQKAPYVLTML